MRNRRPHRSACAARHHQPPAPGRDLVVLGGRRTRAHTTATPGSFGGTGGCTRPRLDLAVTHILPQPLPNSDAEEALRRARQDDARRAAAKSGGAR